MISDGDRFRIERCAQSVIDSYQLTSFPICPISIATSCDIEVVAKDQTDRGVSGMLLRHGDAFAIVYATHIPNEGFKRFSIAHELGHYFLEGHPERLFATSETHVSHAGFTNTDPIELEADHFAAALLMPRKLFLKAMDKRRDGLDAIEGLSDICQTSLLATAIRYAETTPAPVAVVVSRGRSVDYCFLSKGMQEFKGLTWLRKGALVPRESATFALNSKHDAVANAQREEGDSDFSVWLGGSPRLALYEEAIGLGSYGRTLTVLTSSSVADEDDDEDDDQERDRPRFR